MNEKSKTVSENLQDELEPIKDFLEEAEKEKKEYNEHNRDTSKDPFKGTSIEGKD